DRRIRQNRHPGFERGNSGAAARGVLRYSQAAMALSGSRAAGARELWDFNGTGRNPGEREGQSPCGSLGDVAAAVGGHGSGNLVALTCQGASSLKCRATDFSPDSSTVWKLGLAGRDWSKIDESDGSASATRRKTLQAGSAGPPFRAGNGECSLAYS